MLYDTALIIGSGAFGTSIASILSENFKKVIIKVRDESSYQSIKDHENKIYLPGQKLAHNIIPALTWDEADELSNDGDFELIVNGLPTAAIKPYYDEHCTYFKKCFVRRIPFVSLSKGIDPETLELPDDLFSHHFSEYSELITYLSGPSFAKEIVDKQVTIVSLAGKSPEVLLKVAEMLQTDYFKAFPTYDIKGVLLGGALKNILAIAGGILEGLGYNHNTRAAMITRGITEMLRFGKVFNARTETFYSFAGMGDLILTTTSSLSRNKTFGLEIAKGRKPLDIIESQLSVVEGYKTTKAAWRLSQKYQIKTVLFKSIYEILYKDAKPEEVITKVMQLPISSVE